METTTETPQKSKKFAIGFVVILVLGAVIGFYKYQQAQKYESTDDAQVMMNISPVIPHVTGYIKKVYVQDNQEVKKGDTLLVLDDRDYVLRVQQAEAELLAANHTVNTSEASAVVTKANISASATGVNTINQQMEAAKINVWRAQNDFERYANLYKDHSITQQQYEQALAAKQSAEKQLAILQAQKQAVIQQTAAVSSQTKVSEAQIQSAEANTQRAKVGIEAAKLNLSYTVITAAVDGQVSSVNLQPGQLVQAGQALFQVVPNHEKWVVANFKETQLTQMKIGQKVKIKIDAFPDVKFEGKVSSFSPGTGASFSLLPPDNASGNFVKVVQRVPVKIAFDHVAAKDLERLRAGLNADVEVELM